MDLSPEGTQPHFFIRKPINAIFEPLPDITAYELAIILSKVHGVPLYEEGWQSLGFAITRHFKRLS